MCVGSGQFLFRKTWFREDSLFFFIFFFFSTTGDGLDKDKEPSNYKHTIQAEGESYFLTLNADKKPQRKGEEEDNFSQGASF